MGAWDVLMTSVIQICYCLMTARWHQTCSDCLIIAETRDGQGDSVGRPVASPHTVTDPAQLKTEAEEEAPTSAVSASVRPFDVSSLIKKESEPPGVNNNLGSSEVKSSPVANPCPPGSIPASAASLYPYLGLYSQLMSSVHSVPGVHSMPGLMMGAQLALASAHHQTMLASAWAGLQSPPPGPLMADRLKTPRFSPYSRSPPASSESRSAFQSVMPAAKVSPAPGSPPPSPSSHTATTSLRIKTITPPSLSPANSHTSSTSPGDAAAASRPASDIRNIERMVSCLDGGQEATYGISHNLPGDNPNNAMKKSQ